MPALNPTENTFGGGPDLCPTENAFGGDPDAPLRVAKMQDVRRAPRPCGTIARLTHFAPRVRLSPHFSKATVAKPRALVRVFCIHACAKPHRKYFRRGPRRSSSRRKNARRSPYSSLLRNYRTAHSFLLRGCGFRRILARRISQQLSEFSGSCSHIILAVE